MAIGSNKSAAITLIYCLYTDPYMYTSVNPVYTFSINWHKNGLFGLNLKLLDHEKNTLSHYSYPLFNF